MNIFDFEKRLKNHTANSKGEVDMNRLLSDLNIKPQGRSYRKYLFFFISGISLIGLSYLAYNNIPNTELEISKNGAVLEQAVFPTNTRKEVKNIVTNENPTSEKTTTNTFNTKSKAIAKKALSNTTTANLNRNYKKNAVNINTTIYTTPNRNK